MPKQKGYRTTKHLTNGSHVTSLDDKITNERGCVRTVHDCFVHGLRLAGSDRQFLGRINNQRTGIEWLTYGQVERNAQLIGRFLRGKGLKRQQFVGIWSTNSPEWVTCELACSMQSFSIVPMYDTFGMENVRYAVNDVEMTVLFAESEKSLKKIFNDKTLMPTLKILILMRDEIEDKQMLKSFQADNIEVFTWMQALDIGSQSTVSSLIDLPTSGDIFLILYTSGTTGISKGAMITHGNTVATVGGFLEIGNVIQEPGTPLLRMDDRMMPCLPLAHAYTQFLMVSAIFSGSEVVFYCGNPAKLLEEARILKPTLIPLVPRLLNRIYYNVMQESKINWPQFLECYKQKELLLKSGVITKNTEADDILFRKHQAILGGNVRIITSGAAPIDAEVLDFFRVVFGALVINMYGQTETVATSAGVGLNTSSVGHPLMCCDLRLLDIPELGYSINNPLPQGELCVKGPNVIPGYWKQPELTAESLTADGWWLTGDIAEFQPDGTLKLIDRKKHVFKLAQGLYIAPLKVESIYAEVPIVAQVFVDGDSTERHVIAIVVPDEHAAKQWATSQGLSDLSLADLCKNKDLNNYILHAMRDHGDKRGLNSLEQVRSIHLHPELFSTTNGLVSHTMKYKRNILRRLFHNEICGMYAGGPDIPFTRE